MILLNTKKCEIAKICVANSQFKFEKIIIFDDLGKYLASKIFNQLFNAREDKSGEIKVWPAFVSTSHANLARP